MFQEVGNKIAGDKKEMRNEENTTLYLTLKVNDCKNKFRE